MVVVFIRVGWSRARANGLEVRIEAAGLVPEDGVSLRLGGDGGKLGSMKGW